MVNTDVWNVNGLGSAGKGMPFNVHSTSIVPDAGRSGEAMHRYCTVVDCDTGPSGLAVISTARVERRNSEETQKINDIVRL